MNLIGKIATEQALKEFQVNNAVKLLFEEDCTIPFVARYRKEMTGSMDEVALRTVRDRYEYLQELETNKIKYLKIVEEHCQKKPELKDKFPELQKKFMACETKQELEDLYLPFKPKRRTRAQIAREKGLEPLLLKIMNEHGSLIDLEAAAKEFITPEGSNIDPTLKVADVKEALIGAADILAEQISENAEYRQLVREISQKTGVLRSKKLDDAEPVHKENGDSGKAKKKGDAAKYENYFDYAEPINKALPHRIMAVRRGEAEKVLKVGVEVDTAQIHEKLKAIVLQSMKPTQTVRQWIEATIEDSYKRLLSPSIETEIRLQLKNMAEEEAIKVFSTNLENLLLLPPIPNKIVMGVDPGLRTGSKLAVVDDTGKMLDHATIYPDLGERETGKTKQAKDIVAALILKHKVQYLAIGNGTGSREISKVINDALKEHNIKDIKRLVVNEAGASVYSADEIAREEFPDLDPTIRSAISIARRLQDPLAELVKIDPRSIGVGQYQHDVNVTKLTRSLGEVVESCVNRVGVNVNTASYSLLAYVSGIGKTLAKNIVSLRDSKGKFATRQQLMEVTGFGSKAFQQAAGFLRVPESPNPLDNSGVHPERYAIVEQIANDHQKPLQEIVGNDAVVNAIALEKYVTDTVGMPTLRDIAGELIKPGRDPREDGTRLTFSDDVAELEDLKVGMVLPGTVTNVTNFGAFVDIGVHQDGLVHISELTDKFVDDPAKVVSVGQVLQVRVLDVDLRRRRISLSCRLEGGAKKPAAATPKGGMSQESNRGPIRPRDGSGRPAAQSKGGSNVPPPKNQKNYTMDDLLSKFNTRR